MKKKILQTVLFLGIMFLTFYTLLHGQNLSEIYQAVKNMSVPYLIAASGAWTGRETGDISRLCGYRDG